MYPERKLAGLNVFLYSTGPGVYTTGSLGIEYRLGGLSFQEFIVGLLGFGFLFIVSGAFDPFNSSIHASFPIAM